MADADTRRTKDTPTVPLQRVDFVCQVVVPFDQRRTSSITITNAATLEADMAARVVIVDGEYLYPFEQCMCMIRAARKGDA